jgi:putative endonuclease
MPGCRHAVYILASHSRRLYVGVTSDLVRRILEHRSGRCGGITTRYCITRLVYFEATPNIRAAIQRGKSKAGREKKMRLVEATNSGWLDLAADWFLQWPVDPSGHGDQRRVPSG